MNYSAQQQKFIESKLFATSHLRKTDDRTTNRYYIDKDNLVHSVSFNYSLVKSRPLTIEEFKSNVLDDNLKVQFI